MRPVSTVLPKGWANTTIGEVSEIVRGVTYKKENASLRPGNGLVPILRATNIGARLDFDDPVYVPRADINDEQLLRPHDIVLAASSGSRNIVGKAAIVTTPWFGSFGAFCYALRPNPAINARLLAYFLQTSEYRNQVSELSAGVNINNLRRHHIQNLSYRLPPSAEQDEIVAEIEKQFTRLDAAVGALKRVQANLKRYRASVLKAACEGRLVPTEAELARRENRRYEPAAALLSSFTYHSQTRKRAGRLWGSGVVPDLTEEERARLPEGWVWTKVRRLGPDPDAVVQVGPMSMRSQDFTEEGVPVFNVGCVQWGAFDEAKLDFLPEVKAAAFSRYRLNPGDVLFTRSGAVGRCAVVKEHQSDWLMTFHLLRARTDPRVCLPEYLRIVFEGASHISRQTRTASIGTTRAGFNTNLLAELDVPLPPAAEQVRIVAEIDRQLSELNAAKNAVNAALKRSEKTRQSILKTAFEGSLVSQDSNDEPASALLEKIRGAAIPGCPPLSQKPLRRTRTKEPAHA